MTIIKKYLTSIKDCFVKEQTVVVEKDNTPTINGSMSEAIDHGQKNIPNLDLSVIFEPKVLQLDRDSDINRAVIHCRNVTKKFGEKVALDNINFSIRDYERQGRIVAIVGQSGCGKSTLLRMIAGLKPHWPPTKGELYFEGAIGGPPSINRGLVDQKYCLLPHLTIWENIAFGMQLKGIPLEERKEKAMSWIKKVGLDGSEFKYPGALSGGMQQRAAIAATLSLSPQIILMDEPFGALDPKTRLRMQELLISLWKEQRSTIVLVTHAIEEAVYLGDRIFRMGANPGRIIEELHVPRPNEPPEIFRTRPWFTELVSDLRNRLETDAESMGELGSKNKPEVKA
jgi:NitT/TauT family transport system ATP-binding protein